MNVKEYLKLNDVSKWVNGEQGRVDLKILPYLQDIENGFFVEAGALDGLFMTNTKILEDCGWNGLLIEPSKKAVELCRKNRKAPVEECALVSRDYKEPTVIGDFIFDGESGIGAWSSINRKAYGYQVEGKFHAMGAHVWARTLGDVLKKNNIQKVDFLSLDVEGYELEVLNGIDLNEIDVRFMLIEVNLRDYALEDLEGLLAGYKNLGCVSNFSKETNPDWDGSHQDYLFEKNG